MLAEELRVPLIERCPVANGALLSYDATPALAVPGFANAFLLLFAASLADFATPLILQPNRDDSQPASSSVLAGTSPGPAVFMISSVTYDASPGNELFAPAIKIHRKQKLSAGSENQEASKRSASIDAGRNGIVHRHARHEIFAAVRIANSGINIALSGHEGKIWT